MNGSMKDFIDLFSANFFSNLMNSGSIQFAQYNAAVAILIKNRIPFDSEYTPGTRRDDPQLTLTIYINPQTTIEFSFTDFSLTDDN